jgi:HK97 family phage portal protein
MSWNDDGRYYVSTAKDLKRAERAVAKRIKNLSITDEKAWNPSLWNLAGAQSSAGINVNEQNALTFSAVWCAVLLISGGISSLPLHLLIQKDRIRVPATDKPLYRVMHSAANPYMTAKTMRQVLAAHALTWGNGYAEKVHNGGGDVVELWPIPPNRSKPKMLDGAMVYDITVGGEIKTLPREKVLHIPGLGFDGFMGYSVVSMARETIGLGMAMEQFGANFFSQGAQPGIIVTHPGELSEPASKNLSREMSEKYAGLGKAHRLMLLDEGMKLEKVGIPQEDSQYLESRQFQIPEVARWFNLPPHKLKDLTKSSFSNIESEQLSYVVESLVPWLVTFEQCFDMQLLSPQEYRAGYYFKHNVEGMLRGSSAARAAFYRAMFGIGAMSINEIRDKEDMDPASHPFADEYFVPLNMVPLSQLQKHLESKTAPPPAVAPSEPDSEKLPDDPENKVRYLPKLKGESQ